MAIPAQQHREVVKPGDDALQLDAVDEENGDGSFGLAHMVQENILNILRFLSGHVRVLFVVWPRHDAECHKGAAANPDMGRPDKPSDVARRNNPRP